MVYGRWIRTSIGFKRQPVRFFAITPGVHVLLVSPVGYQTPFW